MGSDHCGCVDIAKQTNNAADGSAGNPQADREKAGRSAPSRMTERHHLTVLFADLAGATELTNRLDPEKLRNLLQSYRDAIGVQQEADGERGHIKINRSSVQMSGKQANGRSRIWKQQWGKISARRKIVRVFPSK